jgi:uncharacterized membrane protein
MDQPAAPPGPPAGPLAHIPLFERLDAPEQQALFAAMRIEQVAANQTIFWLGDPGDSFYLVSRGRVAVTIPNERGEHVTLDTLGHGGFFGEISLLDGGPRTATVRALEPSELYVLTRDAFHRFVRQRPDVAIDLLTVMGARQRMSVEALRGLPNPNVAFEGTRVGAWQRVSDIIAMVAASHWFTILHLTWFGSWILINVGAGARLLPIVWAFDPFPFGLLTMVVSLEAIFLSIFVLVSQNRQAEKDRVRIDLDYQVNVKAQTEIMSIGRRLEQIEARLHGAVRGGDSRGRPPHA